MQIKKIHQTFSYLIILLFISGIGNAMFTGTVLAGWKQLLVFIGFVMSFKLTSTNNELRKLLLFTCFLQVTIILTSIICGLTVVVVFYNVVFYSAWVPFFIWAARGGSVYYQNNFSQLTLYLIIASAIGLVVDAQTDIFSFLITQNEVVDTNYFAEHSREAKRTAFIFNASTLVMPTLGGMVVVALIYKLRIKLIVISTVAIMIAIMSTAAANSILIAFGILLGVLKQMGMGLYRSLGVVLLIIVIAYFVLPLLGSEEFIFNQFTQIFDHVELDSDGNGGRFELWKEAITDILNFNIIEHLFGSGLGTTNSNNDNLLVLHTHGESSFLQAYLEAGIFGLSLRLLPFLIFAKLATKYNIAKYSFITIGYVCVVFLADAVAPIFGFIPSQAILGFLIGSMYYLKTPIALKTSIK